jgi:glucosamine kinase
MKRLSKKPVGIGIDIGGTKTHLRIDDPRGMRRDFVRLTADWRVRQWGDDAVALLAIAREFAAGAPIAAIAAVPTGVTISRSATRSRQR